MLALLFVFTFAFLLLLPPLPVLGIGVRPVAASALPDLTDGVIPPLARANPDGAGGRTDEPGAIALAAQGPTTSRNLPGSSISGGSRWHWETVLQLETIASSLGNALPESWEVTMIKHRQVPRKWSGSPDCILIRIENTSIVIHHPRDFDYHPFYKLWLCPPDWEGTMEEVTLYGEEGPAVLLGQNHKMKVLYLTLGANSWPEGPPELRKTLDLTQIPITTVLRQVLEPTMKMKLFPRFATSSNWASGLLTRIIGMEKEGPLAYVEYAAATERKLDGHVLPSRCTEPDVLRLMERENLFLANEIFFAYPDVSTIYLRRVCDDVLSDRIINRSDETIVSPVILSNSSR